MTIPIIAMALAGLLGFYWFFLRPVRYRHVPVADVGEYLEGLLRCTVDGSVAILDHEGSERFVQFIKRTDEEGHDVLDMAFPDAAWSSAYFDSVVDALGVAGIPVVTRFTGGPGVPRFADVCGVREASEAAHVAEVVLRAMGLDGDAMVCVTVKGANRPERDKVLGQPVRESHGRGEKR